MEYVRQRRLRTPEETAEERAEAREAHGLGVKMVNTCTEKHYIS